MTNKTLPEGDIEILINYRMDPSVGLHAINYLITAPDFRITVHEEGKALNDIIEQTRARIKCLYDELMGEVCVVTFGWEFAVEPENTSI